MLLNEYGKDLSVPALLDLLSGLQLQFLSQLFFFFDSQAEGVEQFQVQTELCSVSTHFCRFSR